MRAWLSSSSAWVSSRVNPVSPAAVTASIVVVAAVVVGFVVSSATLTGTAFASAAATEGKDSAAGRAVFIGITVVVIVVAVVLSLKYRKR